MKDSVQPIQARWTPAPSDNPHLISTTQAYKDGLLELSQQRQRLAKRMFLLRNKAKQQVDTRLQQKTNQEMLRMEIELQRQKHQIIKDANRECLNLALSVAREFVDSLPNEADKFLASKISDRLKKIEYDDSISILVHPRSLETIQSQLRGCKVKVKAAKDVLIDTAIVETRAGRIVCSLDQEFSEIAQTLHKQLSQSLERRSVPTQERS